jgi:nicotinate-nucleotide pyrophosphorylase
MLLALTEPELQPLLADEAPYGDLTTRSLGKDLAPARIDFFPRGAMTAAGTEEAARLAQAGVDLLQLGKFGPACASECRAALLRHGLKPSLAAAGGVHAGNAVAYARDGTDLLVTSAPFFAPPMDVKVVLAPR